MPAVRVVRREDGWAYDSLEIRIILYVTLRIVWMKKCDMESYYLVFLVISTKYFIETSTGITILYVVFYSLIIYVMDCSYCHSPAIIKRWWYGKDGHRYKCKSCKRTFLTWGTRKKYSFQEKKHVVQLSWEYSNLTRMSRIYKISKNTIYNRRDEVNKYNAFLQTKMWYY